MSGEPNGGEGIHAVKVPHLTLTLNPMTLQLTIDGWVPSLEFAEALLYKALAETKWKIMQTQAAAAVQLAPPGISELLRGMRG
jgi:hypothetical protein